MGLLSFSVTPRRVRFFGAALGIWCALTLVLASAAYGATPVAYGQSIVVAEDSQCEIALDASDPDGDSLFYWTTDGPHHGSLLGTEPNLIYVPGYDFNGSDSFSFRVSDGDSASDIATVDIFVSPVDDPPLVRSSTSVLNVMEGEVARNSGTWSEVDAGDFVSSMTSSIGTVTLHPDGTWDWECDTSAGPEVPSNVVLYFTDSCSSEVYFAVFGLNVTPVLPEITSIQGQLTPVAVGSPAAISGAVYDPGAECGTYLIVNWGDGTSDDLSLVPLAGYLTFSGSHSYASPGVYSPWLSCGNDDGDGFEQALDDVVVYDATAGSVSGGGSIESLAGAFLPDPSLTGVANFTFDCRYPKGASVPSGKAQFRFTAGGLDFLARECEWMVVTEKTALFRGRGTVSGSGDYAFVLSATDAGKASDLFRIKIWDRFTQEVIYDSQPGSGDYDPPTTRVSGGNIVVRSR